MSDTLNPNELITGIVKNMPETLSQLTAADIKYSAEEQQQLEQIAGAMLDAKPVDVQQPEPEKITESTESFLTRVTAAVGHPQYQSGAPHTVASAIATHQMEKNPSEYSKELRMVHQIEKDFGFSPDNMETVKRAYLTNQYVKHFKNDELPISVLHHPMAKALTPDDYGILRNLFIMGNDEFCEYYEHNTVMRLWYEEQFKKSINDRILSGDINKYDGQKALQLINEINEENGTVASVFGEIAQGIEKIINVDWSPENKTPIERELDMFQNKMASVYEKASAENPIVGLVASMNQFYPTSAGNIAPVISRINARDSYNEFVGNTVDVAVANNLPVREAWQAQEDARLTYDIAMTFGSLANMAIGAATGGATTTFSAALKQYALSQGLGILAGQTQQATLEALKAKGRIDASGVDESILKAGAKGFVSNILESAAASTIFSAPALYQLGRQGYAATVDRYWLDVKDKAAAELSNLSTATTNPQDTADLIDRALEEKAKNGKGFLSRNADPCVYVNAGELKKALKKAGVDINIFNEDARKILGDLDNPERLDGYIRITMGQRAMFFEKSRAYKHIRPLMRHTPGGIRTGDLDASHNGVMLDIVDRFLNLPGLSTSDKEIREQIKNSVHHDIYEQLQNDFSRKVSDLNLDNVDIKGIDEVSKNVSNFMVAIGEVMELNDDDLAKFYKAYMPKFEFIDAELDIQSGTTRPGELGEYIPSKDGNVIRLHKNADLITLMHETSHMFLQMVMNAADQMDNDNLRRIKNEMYTAFNLDPNKKWSELSFEDQTRVQEVFAYDYLVNRLSSAFIPAAEHRENRTLLTHARLNRALGQALLKENGFKLSDIKNEADKEAAKRAKLVEYMGQNKENFIANYGFGANIGASKILVDAIDNMTNRSFVNHRISTLFPWGDPAPFENFKNVLPPDLYEQLATIREMSRAEIELNAAQHSIEAGRELLSNVVNLQNQLENAIRDSAEVKEARRLVAASENLEIELQDKVNASDKELLKAKGAVDELARQKRELNQKKLTQEDQDELNKLLAKSKNPAKTTKEFYANKKRVLNNAKKKASAVYDELKRKSNNAELKEQLNAARKDLQDNRVLLDLAVADVERRIGATHTDIERDKKEIARLREAATREMNNENSEAYQSWSIAQQQYNDLKEHPLSMDMIEGASDETIDDLKKRGLLAEGDSKGDAITYWSSFATSQGLSLDQYIKIMSKHPETKEKAIDNLLDKMVKDNFGSQDRYIDTIIQKAYEVGRKSISKELAIVTDLLKIKNSQRQMVIAERTAKYLRAGAGNVAYSNTSPSQLARRAAYHRNHAYEILINGYRKNGKRTPPDEVLLEVYDEMMWAYTYNELSVTANRVKKDLDASLDRISSTLNSKNVSRYYESTQLEAARVIMNRIGMGKRQGTLINLESIRVIDPDTYDEVMKILNAEGFQTNLSSMTLGDVAKVVDLLQELINDAHETKRLKDMDDAEWIQKQSGFMSEALKAKIESDPKLKDKAEHRAERNLADNARTASKEGRTSRKLNSIRNGTLSIASWLERMDGRRDGVLKEILYQRIADAENKYKDLSNQFAAKLKPTADLMRKLDEEDKFKNMKVEFVTVDENAKAKKWIIKSGPDGSIQKQLMAILVNTGSDSNLEAMARSMDISPDAIVVKLKDLTNDGVITKEMWDAAQNIWDVYSEIGELTLKSHRQMTNKIYKRIPPRKIKTVYGTYSGGYVPVHSIRGEHLKSIEEAVQEFNASLGASADGFTRERIKTNNEIDLTVPAIFDSMERQLRYSVILPEVVNADRLARSSSKMVADLETVREGFFEEVYKPWLVSVANQTNCNVRDLQGLSLLNNMAAVLNASVLSMNITNAMQQVTGLFVAATRVNKAALAHAIIHRKRVDEVANASVFMRNRFNMDKLTLGKLQRDIMTRGKAARVRNFMMDHAYFLQSMVQRQIDTIVWTGKYNEVVAKLQKEGKIKDADVIDKKAIRAADDAVRTTQGSFNTSDSSALERSPVVKALLPFTNYFITMRNLTMSEIGIRNRNARNKFEKIYNAGVVAMFALFLPSVVGTLINQALKGEYYGDEETGDLLLEAGVKSPLMTTLNAVHPVAGVVGTSAWDIFSGKATNNSLLNTPVATFMPQLLTSIKHIYQCLMDDRDLSPNDWGNLVRLSAVYSPQFPNFAKQAGVAAALASGDYDTRDWSDNIRAIITGKLSPAQKGEQ